MDLVQISKRSPREPGTDLVAIRPGARSRRGGRIREHLWAAGRDATAGMDPNNRVTAYARYLHNTKASREPFVVGQTADEVGGTRRASGSVSASSARRASTGPASVDAGTPRPALTSSAHSPGPIPRNWVPKSSGASGGSAAKGGAKGAAGVAADAARSWRAGARGLGAAGAGLAATGVGAMALRRALAGRGARVAPEAVRAAAARRKLLIPAAATGAGGLAAGGAYQWNRRNS